MWLMRCWICSCASISSAACSTSWRLRSWPNSSVSRSHPVWSSLGESRLKCPFLTWSWMAATWLWSSTLSSRETSKQTRTRTNWSRTGRHTWSTGEKARTATQRATIPTRISAQMKNRRKRRIILKALLKIKALKISHKTNRWSLALMTKNNSSVMKAIVNHQVKTRVVLHQRVVLAAHPPWPPSNLSRKGRAKRTRKRTRRSKRKSSVSKTKTRKRKSDSQAWMMPLGETGLLPSRQLALREARADTLRLAGNPAEIKNSLTAPWHHSSTLLQTEAARVPSRQVESRDAFDCKLSLRFDFDIHTLDKH